MLLRTEGGKSRDQIQTFYPPKLPQQCSNRKPVLVCPFKVILTHQDLSADVTAFMVM